MATEKRAIHSGRWFVREVWELLKSGGWKLFPLSALTGSCFLYLVPIWMGTFLPYCSVIFVDSFLFDDFDDFLKYTNDFTGGQWPLSHSLWALVLAIALYTFCIDCFCRYVFLQASEEAHPWYSGIPGVAWNLPRHTLFSAIFSAAVFLPVWGPLVLAILIAGVLKGALFYVLLILAGCFALLVSNWSIRIGFVAPFLTFEKTAVLVAFKRSLTVSKPLVSAFGRGLVPFIGLYFVVNFVLGSFKGYGDIGRDHFVYQLGTLLLNITAAFLFTYIALASGVLVREATRLTRDEADLPA